jgi:DNA-binding PadR family transcriptional regulator
MRIAETEYYIRMTDFLRREPARSCVKFGAEGFIYDSPGSLYISLKRLSKNNYSIIAVYADERIHTYYRSLREAVEDVRQILETA